jgi:hypothetical protein
VQLILDWVSFLDNPTLIGIKGFVVVVVVVVVLICAIFCLCQNLKLSSDSLKQEVFDIQEKWREEISDFG